MSSVSWPWYSSYTIHVGMFLIKAPGIMQRCNSVLILKWAVHLQNVGGDEGR